MMDISVSKLRKGSSKEKMLVANNLNSVEPPESKELSEDDPDDTF